MPSRAQLDRELDALQQTLPAPESTQDASFDFDAFRQKVHALAESADPDDRAHVRERAECILGSAGLIPSDNEGEPCP